ncbi:MAG: ABC transporter permease [Paracoccaceae bacterium]
MRQLSLVELFRRTLHLLLSLFVLLCVTFVIGRVLPTDLVGAIVGELADPAAYEAMRVRLGLDLPLHQQFWIYVQGLARGDLGTAILTGNPVAQDLALAFPATLELATLAILISILFGVPLGLAAAMFRDSWMDRLARVISLLGQSVPVFWLGIVGLVIFYAQLGWVGGPGRVDIFYEGIVPQVTGMMLVDSLLAGEADIFRNALSHIVLPACILAYAAMAYITRMVRSFTLEQLGQDYVITARAKGLGPFRTLTGHILPNIAVQLITVLAISYGSLLEGAVVIEIVFSWPGIGQYMTNALLIGDMNAILASVLVIGIVFMALNFLADISYALLDPRASEPAT